MKALVVAPQPFFTPRGTPFSVYYRTLLTAELGVEIDLLTYGQGQNVDIPGVRIRRIPAIPFFGMIPVGPSLRKLFLDLLLLIWTIPLLLRNGYDFVHAHEESVFFLRFLKPLFRFKLIYDMHSSLPEQLTSFRFTRSPLLIRLFRSLERSCLRQAELVITISPALRDLADGAVPDPSRLFLIENSIFEEIRLEANPKSEPRPVLPILPPPDRSVVAYTGTLEPYQGVDMLLEAHARVLKSHPEAFLLVVGGSPAQVAQHRALAERLGIAEDCLFTGMVSVTLARECLGLASVLVSPRMIGINTPLKIYEYLASGIPMVATDTVSHTQIVDESTCLLASPDAEGFAEAIITALDEPERAARIADSARRLYESKYSRSSYESKMRRLLQVLASCAE